MYNIDNDERDDSDDLKHHSTGVEAILMTAVRGIVGMAR